MRASGSRMKPRGNGSEQAWAKEGMGISGSGHGQEREHVAMGMGLTSFWTESKLASKSSVSESEDVW